MMKTTYGKLRLHQTAPSAVLLRFGVCDLLGSSPSRNRSSWNPGQPGEPDEDVARPAAGYARGPGCRGYLRDRACGWQGGISRLLRPPGEVADTNRLVRGRIHGGASGVYGDSSGDGHRVSRVRPAYLHGAQQSV